MEQTNLTWPSGDGEMAERIRTHDWSATPLGPVAGWSERLKVLVELMLSSPLVSTLACGPQCLLLYNDAAARHFGDHHPAALGRPLPDAFPEGWETVAPFYARAFVGETVKVHDQPLDTRGEGAAMDVFDALLAPVRERDGSVAYVHMTGAEVADRARAEAALRESETRHRVLVERWTQAVWETNADGVVVADSSSWRAYTGQTLKEWLGYGWLDAIHPDDRAYAERQWREAMAVRRVVDAEFRLRAPGGGWRWTNVRAAPVLDAEGCIEKWAGINIDIDARKRAEAALQESEEKFRTVFKTIDHAFVIQEVIRNDAGLALDMRYVEINPAFTRQTGLGPEIVGKLVSEVMPDVERFFIDIHDRVARTGAPERFENYNQSTGRWYDAHITAIGGEGRLAASVFEDVSARKLAEIALRESEERKAFLLTLSDLLRPLSDPAEIQQAAMKLLAKKHDVMRAGYMEVHADGDTLTMAAKFEREVVPLPPQIHLSDYGSDIADAFRAGRTMCVRDAVAEAETEEQRAAHLAIGVQSWIIAPLVKGGRLTAIVGVVARTPRDWTSTEIQLVTDLAERTWDAAQRARAETSLRESEERFAQFAASSADALWIRDAATLTMEYVSPAIRSIYGLPSEAVLGDVERWAALIVPEDRQTALDHIERARRGEAVVHEFRIQRPSDGTFRWIRNTDFPLLDERGRMQRIGGIAQDVTEAKLAVEHQSVLLAELQHRVRNIMGMIRSVANRTAPGSRGVEDYRSLMEGRLLALARVQALLTREANAGGSLRTIIESEVAAQAHHAAQFVLTGPDITLSPKAVEVLTLAFHELATNALKYGALSVPEGRLSVNWTPIEKSGRPWLALDWIEKGAPSREPSTRRGFGSELIEARIPYELGGRGTITIGPDGARCHLEFPLKEGESILETDAPQPTTIFGGTLDMTGAPDLTGRTVLVVEDDYFLAHDTAAALRGAGAEVLGPCPSEDATRALLDDEAPTHAVLDLNLGGGGPQFAIAHLLTARGIPFVFLTGYDPEVIPEDLVDVVRLQKPLPFRAIVEAVGRL